MLLLNIQDVDMKQIAKDLTFTIERFGGASATVTFFDICDNNTQVLLPFRYVLTKYSHLYLPIQSPIPMKQTNLQINGSLYETARRPQQSVFKTAMDYLEQKHGTIITLPCGTGKTNIALAIAAQLRLKTLILCNNIDILTQWKERIQTFLTPTVTVGHIQQDICTLDHDFVVGSIASINSRDYTNLEFGLVIVDEVHHIAAQTFSRSLRKIKFKYILGLTATIERKDKLEKAIYWLIGSPCTTLRPKLFHTTDDQLFISVPKRPDVQAYYTLQ